MLARPSRQTTSTVQTWTVRALLESAPVCPSPSSQKLTSSEAAQREEFRLHGFAYRDCRLWGLQTQQAKAIGVPSLELLL